MQCPCGSSKSYEQCCLLLISQKTVARSPEQLMRSRYSAYTTNAADYIYQTYAKDSQAEQSVIEIADWAKQTTWLKLVIHSASDFLDFAKAKDLNTGNDIKNSMNNENTPTVCFSAYYRHLGNFFLMKEKSRFTFENKQWRYLDGEVSGSEALAKPKRNEYCFCKSQKKFKHCCGA